MNTTISELIKISETENVNSSVLNKIALYYYNNCNERPDNKKELDYFWDNYNKFKTVESINNLAWMLGVEWGEKEKALALKKECLNLKPKSYIPYLLFGYLTLENNQPKEAIQLLKKANELKPNYYLINFILGTSYYKNNEIKKAILQFEKCIGEDDIENFAIYNLALSNLKVNNTVAYYKLIDDYEIIIKKQTGNKYGENDIADLLIANNDCFRAYKHLQPTIDYTEIPKWKNYALIIHSQNKELFTRQFEKYRITRFEYLKEIKENSNPKEWDFENDEEKKESIEEFQNEINDSIKLQNEIENNKCTFDEIEIKESYCYCLLFDCPLHELQTNDSKN